MAGPSTGYNFGNKRQYRRNVWRFIDDNLIGVPIKDRKVLIIDTKDGLETRFLIQRGYRPSNLYVVNKNPAEVAWLTRRLREDGLQPVNTYGVDVFEAAASIAKSGVKLNAIQLDLCGSETDGLLYKLGDLAVNEVTSSGAVVTLTVLRGRDVLAGPKVLWSTIPGLSTDDARIIAAVDRIKGSASPDIYGCYYHIKKFCYGVYKSTAGSQTMLWMGVDLQSHEDAVRSDAWLTDVKKLYDCAPDAVSRSVRVPHCLSLAYVIDELPVDLLLDLAQHITKETARLCGGRGTGQFHIRVPGWIDLRKLTLDMLAGSDHGKKWLEKYPVPMEDPDLDKFI